MKNTLFWLLLSLFGFSLASAAQSPSVKEWVACEATKLREEGWRTAPGLVPLETQLEENYRLAMEKDERGEERYCWGQAMTTAGNFDLALSQAALLAKADLVGKMQTDWFPDDGRSRISQRIGRVSTALNLYRQLENGFVEVRTVVYCSHEKAKEALQQALREELERKADELSKEYDSLLGF